MNVLRMLVWGALAWIVIVSVIQIWVLPRLRQGPRGDAVTGFLWRLSRIHVRLIHRVQFHGLEHLPDPATHTGGLVVIANHTGAIDPFLIQSATTIFIRWMMASNMMDPRMADIWEFVDVIPVERDGRDTKPLREAIRHVRNGGAVGIFPEGRIVNPPREVRPFLPGAGMIIASSGAKVLLTWIHGTPDRTDTLGSLLIPSRAHVEFLGLLSFDGEKDGNVITRTLRDRIAERSGWPLNEEIQPVGGPGTAHP